MFQIPPKYLSLLSFCRDCVGQKEHDNTDFHAFFEKFTANIRENYQKINCLTEELAPRLLKIEEVLFHSRTLKCQKMEQYYNFWERKLYDAVVGLVQVNLEVYKDLLLGKDIGFYAKVVLLSNEVLCDPEPENIVHGLVSIVKDIIKGSKQFVRKYK